MGPSENLTLLLPPGGGWVGGWGVGAIDGESLGWITTQRHQRRHGRMDCAGWFNCQRKQSGCSVGETGRVIILSFSSFLLFISQLPDPADPIYTLAQPALFFSIASTTLHLYWTCILLYNKIIVALIHTVSVFSLNRNNFKALMTLFSWAAKLRILFQNSPSHSVRFRSQLSHENLCQYI